MKNCSSISRVWRWAAVLVVLVGVIVPSMTLRVHSQQITLPPYSELNVYGNNWTCVRGYRKSGNQCVPVGVVQQVQQPKSASEATAPQQSCDKKPIYYDPTVGTPVYGEIEGRPIYDPEELCQLESSGAVEQRAKLAEERARRLTEEAKRASAAKKAAAEAAARQTKIDAVRLKKLAAEAKFAEAEARRKTAEAATAEAETRAKLDAARKVADKAESERIAKLEAERRPKEAEADEAYRKRLEFLVVGLRPESTFMDVAVPTANVRLLPTRKGEVITQLPTGTQVHYIPVHKQPYYQGRYGESELPGADAYYQRCLTLPLHAGMNETDVERVVDSITDVMGL